MILTAFISIKYLFYMTLYFIAFYTFGGYMILIEYTQLCTNFLCKEIDYLEPAYDYIIVGCGSAGSVVALRLAEEKNTTVLVLEAGSYGNKLYNIPAMGPLLQLSSVDWQYQTAPQNNSAKALHSQVSKWPMGRIVGGTGRLNNMVYLRGHASDYSNWYKDSLDYNYERDILTYFKKSEDHRGSYKNDTKFHSTNNPFIVEDLTFETPLASSFLEAVKSLGYSVEDLNRKDSTGFMKAQVNTNYGSRWTPVTKLVNHKNENLKIQTNTYVQKVLFKFNYEAYGVEYSYLGEKLTVQARKGVILSAGVIGTPKILMLSGIGPKEHLTNVQIKTKVDLPVGNNLQDHVTTGLDLVLLNTTLGVNVATLFSLSAVWNYFFHSSGTWTFTGAEVVGVVNTEKRSCIYENWDNFQSPIVSEIANGGKESVIIKRDNDLHGVRQNLKGKPLNTASKYLPMTRQYKEKNFINTRTKSTDAFNSCSKYVNKKPKCTTKKRSGIQNSAYLSDDNCQPDLEFMVLPIGASFDNGGHTKRILGLTDKTWKDYFVPLMGKNAISIIPVVLHPKSTGTVRLLDKNPNSYPLVNPNYLSHQDDIKTLLKGIEIIKKIITTDPMQKLGAKLNTNTFPGCENFKFDTEPYWECYVRHLTITAYHPGGTCKMGNAKDKTAVVGYDFRVHGTNKLYVADASIMPSLPSGNPNAVVIMIGEKVVDEIKYNNFLIQKKCAKREILIPKIVCQI